MNNKHAIHKQLTTHNSQLTNYAFTLAETLIVMGIIGVVAALTLPNLNSSTGDKEKVAKVKKIHQNVQDALGRAIAVYGPEENWYIKDDDLAKAAKRRAERITEFMKISKDCGTNCTKGCFSSWNSGYCYKLADGTSIGFDAAGDWFVFDIDGPKGANKWGQDLFGYDIYNVDYVWRLGPDYKHGSSDYWDGSWSSCFNGGDCLKWVIDYGNMDYLKAGTDGKCKSNTSITLDGVSNITCK